MATVLVGIIMGSQSDWETMQHAAQMLDQFGIPYESRVVSAHRTPHVQFSYAETAAKRGLRAQGIEYNPDMVDLSKRNATAAGVGDKATFVKADLFETDFSKAQVVTMFLLPSINLRLRPKILEMKPGTRIVSNTFTMDDWQPDETSQVTEDCTSWCTALLWIVPAKVEGTWQMPQGALTLTQKFQMVSGMLGSTAISDGRLRGDDISFTANGAKYTGKVNGNSMSGTMSGGSGGKWSATRK